ncbi:hypothetical protein Lser_V15G33493 [Lactuca serriola]
MIFCKLPKSKRFSTFTRSPSRSSSSSSSRGNHQSILSLVTLLKSSVNPSLKHYNNFLLQLFKTKKFRFITHFISQLNSNQIEGDHITHSIFTRALLKQHHYEKAVEFINTQIGKTPTILQNRILDSLVQGFCVNAKDPERGFSVLQDYLKIDGIIPSSFTFCALISSFSRQGKMDRAIEVLEVMTDEKFKYPFDNFVFSAVISGFINVGKPELAVGFYENAAKSTALQMNIVTYTCILSAYCRLKRFEQVSELLNRVEKDGLASDVVFYGNLVYELFRAGTVMEALQKHNEMVERKIEMDAISYTILIDGFSKEGLVEKAIGFLHVMEKEGIRPNLITFTTIISGFCKKGKLEEALRVFNLVNNLGMEVDEFAYATLIDGFCRIHDFDFVFHMLDEMNEKAVHPSVVTYNIIINGLCKVGRTNEAYDLLKGIHGDIVTYTTVLHGYIQEKDSMGLLMTKKTLEEAQVCMDVVMCNTLIKALFLIGSFEDAYTLYKGMPETNLVANHVTFCTLIDGYCKYGRIEEALEVFDEFRRTSMNSVTCYNSIINGLCKTNMIDMAIQVFIELNERGMPLNPHIHQMLLHSIIKTKGQNGILDFVSRIKNLGLESFHIICNDALCCLCDGGFFESASDLYMFMRNNGSFFTINSYNSFLELLVKDQELGLEKICVSDFVKEFGIFDSRVSKIILRYLCMKDINIAIKFLKSRNNLKFPIPIFKKLIKNGRVIDAFNLMIGSKERLPFMDVVDYTILVDALFKEGYIRKALEICCLAMKHGVTLNVITYNSIINGLCHQGCFLEAFRLFDSLEKQKIDITPSEITYATLIDVLSKERYLLDAKELFERMILKGFKPNIRVYNSLINGYSKIGKLPEVLKIVADLDEKHVKPDEFTISAVINSFCRNGNMEGALEYYFDSRRNDLFPDLLGFFYLIRGLCSKGRMEESRSVLRDMLEIEKIVDLLKKVDTGDDNESLDHFLDSLCDQGNIREAILLLDEIVRMFFPVGKKFDEGRIGLGGSQLLISDQDDGVCDDFEAYYNLLASLCSRGELKKANKVAKLLSGFDGG